MLLVALLILAFSIFALPSSVESVEKAETPQSPSGTLGGGSPQNVTYRLLAIEHYFDSTPMKSAQWLTMNLTRADKDYKNWRNVTWGGSKYTSYIHLLSYVPYASINPAAQKYYRGVPTNSNVVSEIQNFLAQTGPGENNSLTIRILYYNGHSGKNSSNGNTSYYMCLGTYGSHPSGRSQYQELFDTQLNTLLNHADLRTNNCTLVMLDTCYSGGFINKLSRGGRVILTACKSDQTAWGWIIATPAPGYWAWFTGHESATFKNSSKLPVGIIGGIHKAKDTNNDGWRSAGEIWTFANTTTYQYAKDQGRTMNPQRDYWVLGGGIPLVMYSPIYWIVIRRPFQPPLILGPFERGFVLNAAPWKLIASPIHDWATFHSDPARTGVTLANGPSTSPLWSKSLDQIYSSAAIHEGIIFVGTLGGGGGGGAALYALSWETGETFWKYTTNSPIYSSPTVINGAVIFGTDDGRIIALEEYSGMLRWSNHSYTKGAIRSSPAVADGLVFVGSNDGYIQAFNETTGVQVWNCYINGQVESSPAVSNGKVFVGIQGSIPTVSCLVALDELTGSPLWSALPGSPVVSTPAVANNKVFVGTIGGMSPPGIYAYSDSGGPPLWNYPLPGPVFSSPAVDSTNNAIIVGCSDGRVYAFNALGALKWQYPPPMSPPIGPVERSSPAISRNGLVYFGSMDGQIYCLTESSGTLVWNYPIGGQIQASPTITDDHVIIGSLSGDLYNFGPPTPVHDITVLGVKISKTITSHNRNITITYTVKNNGNTAENIAVEIGYNTTQLWTPPLYNDTKTIATDTTTITAGATLVRTVKWNTTDLDYGYYTISVNANPVAGETVTADNTYVGSTVMISIQGDANGDRSINVFDILAVKSRWGSTPASPDWIPEYDVNDDDSINVFDILAVKANWGKTW